MPRYFFCCNDAIRLIWALLIMNTNKRHLPTKLYVYLGLFCLIFCLVSCNSTKELSKNQYLLKSNHVILQDKSEVPKEDLEDIIKQKPKTTQDLIKIYGLASKKIEKFGEELINVIVIGWDELMHIYQDAGQQF